MCELQIAPVNGEEETRVTRVGQRREIKREKNDNREKEKKNKNVKNLLVVCEKNELGQSAAFAYIVPGIPICVGYAQAPHLVASLVASRVHGQYPLFAQYVL